MGVGRPRFSVVIPAHDEQRVIGRCLGFVADLEPDEAEVVVAANGCSDETAVTAKEVRGVTVIDLPVPGKVGALNAGDAACSALPRIYLDADIVVDGATLRLLAERLQGSEPRVASPRVSFVLDGRPWMVRAFYQAYTQLPYVRDGLVGLGLYAVSAAGRERWGQFPDVTADDLFVQRMFAPDERLVLDDCSFQVQTPQTLSDLVRVRTRTVFGNNELAAQDPDGAFAASAGGTQRALLALVRKKPSLLPAAIVYTVVMLEARRRARGRSGGTWHRDASTR